jgi:ribonuclease D
MPTFPQGALDVVDAPSALAATAEISTATEIAVDVEADAMHAFHARLCFVQVGTDSKVFLFDTLVPEVRADLLAATFADPSKTKYFHAAGGDLQYLSEAGVRVKGLFDTHRAATLLGWPKVGLADLVLERLQVKLLKEHQQSDFSLRPMPPGMRDYIADDVRYLCEIGRQVREECRKADILEEVELDCQRLSDEAANRPDLLDFRPKIPKGGLSTAQSNLATAIAQALHPLRVQWAEAANVPLGRMLSNAALIAIATSPPTNARELHKAQGVRGPFVREHGEEVLSVVAGLVEKQKKGELEAPKDDRGVRDPQRRKREEALKVFRAAKATARKVTPSVVLTNPLAELLAAKPPANVEELAAVPYFGEKRTRLYGAELIELLGQFKS